ncbi:MAG: ABC transporter substrate-binding protein [Gammaproteobacteria bacterium]|nr:ABC transporter substrate-binding protein [Gammaproteobacteria bacterium]
MPHAAGVKRPQAALVAALLALAACSNTELPPPPPPSEALEGALSIIAWPGYVERGATDPRYDWATQFERDTGCRLTVKTAGTSDEMVALMNRGGYDLVTASGDATLRLVRGGMVQPIDVARVAGYDTIDPRLREAPWHFVDGKHYGVPYQWVPNVLMYNTRVFRKPPSSWAVVFEGGKFPDGKPARGRVQAYDGPIYIADAALYLMAHQRALRIVDPYELNETQYAAALGLLRAQHRLIHRYWQDPDAQVQDFIKEGVVVSGSWPYQAHTLSAKHQPIASTIPGEGSTGWADTTMLHARARHPNCAYQWLSWSLTPRVQGDVASWFGSVPAVPAACRGNTLLGAEGCRDNGSEDFDRLHFWRTPEAACKSQGSCVPYSRWSTDYIAVMGGR